MQTVTLNNGVEMPILGFGVYQVPIAETTKAVSEAIEVGYRLFDTAQAYQNEEGVGNAIKNSGIDRKEFFLVTKVWITNAGESKAYQSILDSLAKLQTDYVDLLLIHQPFNDYYGTYRAMERAYQEGKARAIGISNFYPDRYVDLSNFVTVKPAVNQMETHVFQQQAKLHQYLAKHKTQLMAWAPFAEGKNNYFQNETLTNIGAKYGKSSAQVALRFLTQEGVVVIPKSVKKERMIQNFNIFDFMLTEEELQQIRALDTKQSLFFSHYDPDFVQWLFNYIS